MKYKFRAISFVLILAIAIQLFPAPITAQELPPLPGSTANLPGLVPFPTVPISNPAYEAKETGINIGFGARIPISWDAITIAIAKKFIERMVDSTVKWINNGFDGNPAYATDPKQYFGDIADGVAGEFIRGSDLAFLCSPFQTNIKLSLIQNYYEPQPFQCTLTDVVGNIEDFYDNFNQGGWDAWFSMTQNPTNNPYGAYLEAKIELDSRIASAVGLEREQLNWNSGFLGFKTCKTKNPEPWINDPGVGGNLPSRKPNPKHVPNKPVGVCIEQGPIETPGKIIEGQLQNVLGTGVRQLELADEFDELIGALLGQLLQKTVFGVKGLFGTTHKVTSGPGTPTPPGGGGGTTPPGQTGVTHTIYAGNVVIITATVPQVLGGQSIDVFVDGESKFKCSYTPCNYSNTYEDGAYSYNALFYGETTIDIGSGTFTLPVASTPPPPGGGGGTYPPPSNGEDPPELEQVSKGSANWAACTSQGNEVACHKFIREVASALAAKDSAWGLITKNPGENQCTLEACGGNVSGGYGIDVIAYLPDGAPVSDWQGYDIIRSVGFPGATLTWSAINVRRPGNDWAPVP